MAATFPLPGADETDASSRSIPSGPGPRFRRSSHSQGADATCVEVAVDCAGVAVRDSKDEAGPVLRFSFAEWQAFLLGVRDGEFEPPEWPHRSSANRSASSS